MQGLHKQLYLASASPRRKALLKVFFPKIKIFIPKAREKKAPGRCKSAQHAKRIVIGIAEAKAAAAYEQLRVRKQPFTLIAADTLVFHRGRVLGKPRSRATAKAMLRSLSGQTHYVYTAVTIWSYEAGALIRKSIAVRSDVRFRKLSPTLLEWYLETGEPMDKAGAYGAQERGAALIANIQGSYTNVVGLPMGETLDLLTDVWQKPWTESGHA